MRQSTIRLLWRYATLVVITATAIFSIINRYKTGDMLISFFRVFLGMLVIYFVVIGYYNKKMREFNWAFSEIAVSLLKECDPSKFLRKAELLLKKTKNLECQEVLQVNIASAQIMSGNFKAAENILHHIKDEKYENPFLKVTKLYNLIVCNLGLERHSEAQNYSEALKNALKNIAQSSPIYVSASNYIKETEARFAILERNYDKALEWYEESFAQKSYASDRANCKYYLSVIYGLKGEPEKERACLEYVVEHGNKLYNAVLAKERLRKII